MRGIIIHFRYNTEESAYVDFICNRIGFFCGNYSNSCKMWFHLKLLFAKNMRKAERALAFRISGSKCPFLTYLLLCYSSKSFANHRSDNHCNDHFAQIRRNERNDTDCKCCAYCIAGLEAEPCCSKCVADCSSDDHSEDLDSTVREFVNDNTLTVYIKRLREKIEDDPAAPKIILTVRGMGYRLGDQYAAQ